MEGADIGEVIIEVHMGSGQRVHGLREFDVMHHQVPGRLVGTVISAATRLKGAITKANRVHAKVSKYVGIVLGVFSDRRNNGDINRGHNVGGRRITAISLGQVQSGG
jgi:hypothetical protein